MKKRILSLVCVLALCLTLLPMTVLAAEPVYLALGDSITTGYAPTGVNQNGKVDSPFADQVAAALDYDLTNLAEDGETTTSLLAKLQSGSIDVSSADLITITIGGNDLMGALYEYLAVKWNEDSAHEQNQATADSIKTMLTSGTSDTSTLMVLVNYLTDFAASTQAQAALGTFAASLSAIVTAIKTANPDVTLLVATQYNPYSYLAQSLASNPTLGQTATTISNAFDAGVTALNNTITSLAASFGFTVADVYSAFETAVAAGTNPCNPSAIPLSLDFHPNQTGHDLIAAAIIETLQPQSAYAVTVEDADHGSVQSTAEQAAAGVTVTLTVAPDEGYELSTLTVTGASGNAVTVTKVSDTQYTFTMPASAVTVEAVFAEISPEPLPFDDVAEGTWYYDAVAYVYELGLMGGYGNGTFGPNDALSRAQLCQILYNAVGQPSVSGGSDFTDVADGVWYTDAITWAAANGIVNGYSSTTFGPNDAITREQLATMLYRFAQALGYDVSVGEDTNILSYTDAADVAEYAVPAMQWACGTGVIKGVTESTLVPRGTATRAQVATMLMRFVEQTL